MVIKLVCSILALFVLYEMSRLSLFLLNAPSDFALVGAVLVTLLSTFGIARFIIWIWTR